MTTTTATTDWATTIRWVRERDDYGRSVHHLRDETYRTLGVVVRVPRWTPASILPSPYFVTTWDRYTTPDQEPTYAGHHVPSLKAGKALLEEWAR